MKLATSRRFSRPRRRGALLADPVDSFWVTAGPSFDGKPFKSVTQGTADLTLIPRLHAKDEPAPETDAAITNFLAFTKATLGEAVADVRVSDRLTDSAVCLVAPEHGPDRQLEKLLAGAGRITSAAKPILEVNPRHQLIVALAGLGDDRSSPSRKTPPISCSMRRGYSMASARPMRGCSPTGLGRVLGLGLRGAEV